MINNYLISTERLYIVGDEISGNDEGSWCPSSSKVISYGGEVNFALAIFKKSRTITNDLTHLSLGVRLRQSGKACKEILTAHPV
jgi:hypothetical protein